LIQDKTGLNVASKVRGRATGAAEILAAVNYDHIFDQAIERLHAEGRYRVFIDILRNKGAYPNARCFAGHNGPKDITVWCSNDYLAMGQHPKVIEAMEQALHDVGAGSGGTRNIGGNTHYHVDLERELADLHGKDGALLFTSGYVSNDATLSTLAKILPGCVIFSDELNHASMIAGIRNSGAEKRVWRHNGPRVPQTDRLRIGIFDGRRCRPDPRNL
jgi:5-aminolevulinate synthase